VATGIARTSLKDPLTMAMAHHTLTEAFPERFLLGLGGHRSPKQRPVPGMSGFVANDPTPVETTRAYLEAMDQAPLRGFAADVRPRRALAALGPKMLRLAAEHTWGAHPYFVPVDHTAKAREILGPESLLAVEQAVVLGNDRDVAREHVRSYLVAAHHNGNLKRLGFTDDDLAGSDRLVDAIVATGDADAIAKRVREHLDAGANHVCIQVLTADSQRIPLAEWRELAGLIPRPVA
jgi:probable F420-dependent oxidoreductase